MFYVGWGIICVLILVIFFKIIILFYDVYLICTASEKLVNDNLHEVFLGVLLCLASLTYSIVIYTPTIYILYNFLPYL